MDDGQRLKKTEGRDFGKSADNDEQQTHTSVETNIKEKRRKRVREAEEEDEEEAEVFSACLVTMAINPLWQNPSALQSTRLLIQRIITVDFNWCSHEVNEITFLSNLI